MPNHSNILFNALAYILLFRKAQPLKMLYKTTTSFISILVFTFATTGSKAQKTCTVQIKSLQGTYEGGCLKGLANGQGCAKGVDTYKGTFKNGYPNGTGKYVWANGNTYEGEWKRGLRNGVGKYSYIEKGETKIKDGYWRKNVYTNPKQIEPIIVESKNVSPNTFFKRVSSGNKLSVFFTNKEAVVIPESLFMVATTGGDFEFGDTVGFVNIVFPFTCKIRYRSSNGIVTNDCVFIFTIEQEGDWNLTIKN